MAPMRVSARDPLSDLGPSEASLRRTARRFSLCADDAEDAYQRAVEIMLTRSPPQSKPAKEAGTA